MDYIHYPAEENYFKNLRQGDWLITCLRQARGYDVSAPARFLERVAYPRGHGRRRHLLLVERATDSAPVRWAKFRPAAPIPLPSIPRTRAISRAAEADALLRLWDARGRFRPKSS